MKLKTIINTNNSLLVYGLIVSVSAHLCAWLLAPSYNRSLFLNEIMTAKVLTVKDHFIEIESPLKPTEKDVEKASLAYSKVKERPVKKIKRRRVSKRRQLQKKNLRRQRSHKPEVQAPKTKVLIKPEVVASASQAKPHSSLNELTKEKQDDQSSTKAQPLEKGPQRVKETQVAQRISKSALRGILRGYYKNLNSLMSTSRDYPRSARRLGLEGTVLVEMVINNKGRILSVKLAQSSGHEVLDQAAIAQVHKIGKVPSIPNQIKRNSMTFRIPFEYRLQS